MTPQLVLPDAAASADLHTFVGRAKQLDPGAAIRLVAHGRVLAVYASALHGAGGPTVLAMRVAELAEFSDTDLTVPVAALIDRLASIDRSVPTAQPPGGVGAPVRLSLPPTSATGASWAGMVPPRTGWSVEGVARVEDLRRAARAGIDEVAAGTPQLAGAAAVARLRAMVWGRPLSGHTDLPAGTAFAAEVFGFLGPARQVAAPGSGPGAEQGAAEDAVSLHRSGRWWRLSTTRGHVLARPAAGLAQQARP
jgi:hypothetical protein